MIRVVTVDEHEVFRTGLKTILGSTSDIKVVGEACSAQDALELIVPSFVDVLIIELASAGRGGLDLIRQVKLQCPLLPILVLTAQCGADFANRALKAGASGYLTKDSPASQIIVAVRRLATGRVFVSDEMAELLMLQLSGLQSPTGHSALTGRELEVFLRIAKGDSCTEIARALSLSVKTISTHKANILDKMQLTSTADVVQYAVGHKLVPAYVV